MERWRILLFLFLFSACKPDRKVETSFYYWKTAFQISKTEQNYLNQFHSRKIFVRIMDVDLDENGLIPIPVSPVFFKEKLPAALSVVPVVFLVNRALKNLSQAQLDQLSSRLIYFVNGKVDQAGKTTFQELQIDCDWTASTRENYFYLLKKLQSQLKNDQLLSVTLRLHQLKNQQTSGVPPVKKVMLMCYNMGNLRKYGAQNSILELAELKKYLNKNLADYPLPTDIGLPLFSWAVVFRNQQYTGISKRLNQDLLRDKNLFLQKSTNFYVVKTALPQLGLKQNDKVRWENISADDLQSVSNYLSGYLKPEPLNLIFFHLDEPLLKNYTHEELEKTADLLR
ncbi:MAG: hypothetical protein ACRYGB_12880 [Janthinobacterium lividum]